MPLGLAFLRGVGGGIEHGLKRGGCDGGFTIVHGVGLYGANVCNQEKVPQNLTWPAVILSRFLLHAL
jgi:hypothetical protein